jgi:hypothetical protein
MPWGGEWEKAPLFPLCTCQGKGSCIHDFGWGHLREDDHLGGPGIDRRIILKWTFNKWDGSMDWIELAQDRDRWRSLVNAVMNLRVP